MKGPMDTLKPTTTSAVPCELNKRASDFLDENLLLSQLHEDRASLREGKQE